MTATTASSEAFRALLKRHREARRWSQERVANECAIDHSLVSRIESGQRNATREAIGKLVVGLDLTPDEGDALLVAAGYMPTAPESTIRDEPDVQALYRLLRDERVPVSARVQARHLTRHLVALVGMEV